MQSIIDLFMNNWDIALAIFFVLEKLVKLSPTKYDDILLDMIWNGVKKVVGK
jgi:hypothetical protein